MDREGGSDGSSCFYTVLGLRKDASASDIRSAYKKLALRWHPDRFVKNPSLAGDANVRFQRIQEAYSVLSDEGKKSMYDAGVLDLFDEDEGMNDFMTDLLKMMESNKASGVEESFEDLQRSFMETFGADLAAHYQNEDQTAKKRACEGPGNAKAAKRTSRV